MKKKMYCQHCQKTYKVPIDDLQLMMFYNAKAIEVKNESYYYDDDCFFKTLNLYKKQLLDQRKLS